jgi:hypothetical protein
MYVEKLNRLAEFLDTLPDHRFYLGAWFGVRDGDRVWSVGIHDAAADCNTTACIAGWQTFLDYPDYSEPRFYVDAEEVARETLELTQRQADWLFLGEWLPMSMDEVWRSAEQLRAATPKQAAEAIRTLVKNEGRVS